MDYCTPVDQDAWPVSYDNDFEYSFSVENEKADTQVAIYDYERADEHIITVVFRGSEVPDLGNRDHLPTMAYLKKLKAQIPSFVKGTPPFPSSSQPALSPCPDAPPPRNNVSAGYNVLLYTLRKRHGSGVYGSHSHKFLLFPPPARAKRHLHSSLTALYSRIAIARSQPHLRVLTFRPLS